MGRKEFVEMESIEVYLQGMGIGDILLVEVAAGSRVRDLIALVPAPTVAGGEGEAEPAQVWLEEIEAPLDLELTLKAAGISHHSRVHVHHCQKILVSVAFNGETIQHPFAPSTTVKTVMDWAVERLRIDPAQAQQHELELVDTHEHPREDFHIGTLVGSGKCTLAFNLVPKSRIEG
jgi:hypothetical protein